MKKKTIYIVAILLSLLCDKTATAEFVNGEFANELYAPEVITETIMLRKATDGLTGIDKNKLLIVKRTLTAFLKSFDNDNQDSMLFLTEANKNKYVKFRNLYAEEFGAEAILEYEIYDFVIRKDIEEIIIYLTITETTEGVDTTRQSAIAFIKDSRDWKISRFGKSIESSIAEESAP